MPVTRDQLIDSAPVPDGGGELRLYRRGRDFAIKVVGGGELMNTRTHGSEDRLAELGCAAIALRPLARVLVGGLGMGFTLAATLRALGPNAEVVVAELVPAVVRWNRELTGERAGHPLQDPRATVRECDVAQVIAEARDAFDAILLDVDNGPEGLTHHANDQLYAAPGLAAAHAALRRGGVLAVWSAHLAPAFTARLKRAGFAVEEVPVRAHGNRGARHVVWLARKA